MSRATKGPGKVIVANHVCTCGHRLAEHAPILAECRAGGGCSCARFDLFSRSDQPTPKTASDA